MIWSHFVRTERATSCVFFTASKIATEIETENIPNLFSVEWRKALLSKLQSGYQRSALRTLKMKIANVYQQQRVVSNQQFEFLNDQYHRVVEVLQIAVRSSIQEETLDTHLLQSGYVAHYFIWSSCALIMRILEVFEISLNSGELHVKEYFPLNLSVLPIIA